MTEEERDELMSTIAYLIAEIKILYCIHVHPSSYAEDVDLASAGEKNEAVMKAREVMRRYGG